MPSPASPPVRAARLRPPTRIPASWLLLAAGVLGLVLCLTPEFLPQRGVADAPPGSPSLRPASASESAKPATTATATPAGATATRALPAPPSPAPAARPRTVLIRDLTLGRRVTGANPHLSAAEVAAAEPIDPAYWRRLVLVMEGDAEGFAAADDAGAPIAEVDLELLRPLHWLVAAGARVGGYIDLDLPELGVCGPARVLAIEPCPAIKGDPGDPRGIVTGLIRHRAAPVLDLSIAGLDQPIGTTAAHPFWSEDRQDFVPAGALAVGEQVRTLQGLAKVTAIVPRGPPEPVYNLEVYPQHVYQVSDLGVLVHNVYPLQNRMRALPGDGGGVYVIGLDGTFYIGSSIHLRQRLSASSHKHAAMIRDPKATIEVHLVKSKANTKDVAAIRRAAKVVEQDLIDKHEGSALNIIRALGPEKLEAYREMYSPVVRRIMHL